MVSCGKAVTLVSGLERFEQYDVGVYLEGEHDEVVTSAGADGETTNVVGIYFSDGLYYYIKIF